MRTTVNIEENILKKAKKSAEVRGITLGEFMEEAIKICLNVSEQKKDKPFNLITVKGQLVNPQINLDRTSEILTAEDESIFSKK